MRNFKYELIVTGTPSWQNRVESIRTDKLKPLLETFESMFLRMANLAVMPAMIAFYVRRDQVLISNASVGRLTDCIL